jgi:hypothetical protein
VKLSQPRPDGYSALCPSRLCPSAPPRPSPPSVTLHNLCPAHRLYQRLCRCGKGDGELHVELSGDGGDERSASASLLVAAVPGQ